MAVVDISTELDASPDAVWTAVKTPSAFRTVTRRLIAFPAATNPADRWSEGETVTGWVLLFGFIPFSRHTLHIARIDETNRTLSSRERGGILRRWDHDIVVTGGDRGQCHYQDRIELDAGAFTPVVALYARWFYRARQRRWRALARTLQ